MFKILADAHLDIKRSNDYVVSKKAIATLMGRVGRFASGMEAFHAGQKEGAR